MLALIASTGASGPACSSRRGGLGGVGRLAHDELDVAQILLRLGQPLLRGFDLGFGAAPALIGRSPGHHRTDADLRRRLGDGARRLVADRQVARRPGQTAHRTGGSDETRVACIAHT